MSVAVLNMYQYLRVNEGITKEQCWTL